MIVGAGPTGLTLACELARRNVAIRIIDHLPRFPVGSRAKGLQPRSLEVFDDIGIGEKVLKSGSNEIIFRRYSKDKLIGESGPDKSNLRTDTKYHHFFFIPQWQVEQLLREKLASFGITVELNTALESITQTGEYVVANILKDKTMESVQCSYLAGCDGGKSTVRKILNIDFHGETHEDERMLIGDVEVEGLVADAWHVWIHSQYGMSIALCPLPGTNSWQLQAAAIPDENGNIPEPTLENFRRIFQEQSGMPHVQLKNLTWQSLYRVNVRMADRFNIGRVFITGDAAHVHSVAGGLGMNTGIQDAYNLGWKIAAVFNNHANVTLLDTYEEERLPVAAWTLNMSSERQKIVVNSARQGQSGMETSASKDTTQLNINYRSSSLSVDLTGKKNALHAGDRAPDIIFSDEAAGYKLRLFDYYMGTNFIVLAFGKEYVNLLNDINELFKGKVSIYLVAGQQQKDLNVIDDRFNIIYNVYGNQDALFVIRPDGYIGLIAKQNDGKHVINYLEFFLGKPSN